MVTSVELILNLAEVEWRRSCELLKKVEEDWRKKLTDNTRSKVAVAQRAVVEQGRASSSSSRSSSSSSDPVREPMDDSCDKRRREEMEPFQGW